MAERLKAHAWNACIRQRIEGSNPSLSAILHFPCFNSPNTLKGKVKLYDPLLLQLFAPFFVSPDYAWIVRLHDPVQELPNLPLDFALLAFKG